MKILSLSYDVLNILFSYDPETGLVFWNRNGKLAGSANKNGYIVIDVEYNNKRTKLYAHRIAYCLYTKQDLSALTIDHLDNNPKNNKINNLRLVPQRENLVRKTIKRGNFRFKYQGITSRDRSYGIRYYSIIAINGKRILGAARKTQKAAYKDYLMAFEMYNGFENMCDKLKIHFLKYCVAQPLVS